MTDFDAALGRQLDLLVPATATTPNWSDVLARLRPPVWRRPLVVALAAALALVVTGAGITAALGGFDRWLSGKPGKPAAPADQARFRAANGRSWAAFPTGTKLRQLIDTTVGGRRYVLFGFRSGNEICLRLRAVTLGHTLAPNCVPASALTHLESPLLAVVLGGGLPDQYNHPNAEFSYGIVADGIDRVIVHATDGTHRAVIGGNAYLWVENKPNTDTFVDRVTAVGQGTGSSQVSVPAFALPFRPLTPGAIPGPTHVQAKIANPSIGWFDRREPRGLSPAQAKLTPSQRHAWSNHGFTRLVKPDPLSNIVVGLTGSMCLFVVGNGESCDTRSDFFSLGPVNAMLFGTSADGFLAVAGAAADGITQVKIFTGDGQRIEAALRDNLFSAFAPDRGGVRIVGYDAAGRVAGLETFAGFGGGTAPADAMRAFRPLVTVRAPRGARGTLSVGHRVKYLRCWRARFSTGQSQTGCLYLNPTGPWTSVDGVQPAGRDLFVFGDVRAPVVRVRMRFADGTSIGARPAERLFMFAVPRAELSRKRQLAFVIGYDKFGNPVQRQGVLFRQNP